MALKEELAEEIGRIFRDRWDERDGTSVPSDEDISLTNDGVNLEATVLYADMADSTALVDSSTKTFAAEVYKSFLRCAARIVGNEGGEVTAYDGDRLMAVYLGASKNTSAARTALKINYAVIHVIVPAMKAVYTTEYQPKHVVGVDTSSLFVAKTGVRAQMIWCGSGVQPITPPSSPPFRTLMQLT